MTSLVCCPVGNKALPTLPKSNSVNLHLMRLLEGGVGGVGE